MPGGQGVLKEVSEAQKNPVPHAVCVTVHFAPSETVRVFEYRQTPSFSPKLNVCAAGVAVPELVDSTLTVPVPPVTVHTHAALLVKVVTVEGTACTST